MSLSVTARDGERRVVGRDFGRGSPGDTVSAVSEVPTRDRLDATGVRLDGRATRIRGAELLHARRNGRIRAEGGIRVPVFPFATARAVLLVPGYVPGAVQTPVLAGVQGPEARRPGRVPDAAHTVGAGRVGSRRRRRANVARRSLERRGELVPGYPGQRTFVRRVDPAQGLPFRRPRRLAAAASRLRDLFRRHGAEGGEAVPQVFQLLSRRVHRQMVLPKKVVPSVP